MRNLFLSAMAFGLLLGSAPAFAVPGVHPSEPPALEAAAGHTPMLQAVQYYEPGWREREEWRRRREIEWRRREEWRRRQEAREYYRAPPPPYYGPRY